MKRKFTALLLLAGISHFVLAEPPKNDVTVSVVKYDGLTELIKKNAGKVIETKLGFLTYALALLGVFLLARWLRRREAVTP